VGVGSDFGFAPANYIELLGESVASANTSTTAVVLESAYEEPPAPAFPQRPSVSEAEEESRSPEEYDYKSSERTPVGVPTHGPAAAIAGILHRQHGSMSSYDTSRTIPAIPPQHVSEVHEEPEEDEGPPPALPRRPPAESTSPPIPEPTRSVNPSLPSRPQIPPTSVSDAGVHESPPYSRVGGINSPRSPSGYHIYNISEMVSVLGKRKKMPTTLGINVATGTIFISPEDAPDNEKQEWTADRLSHYSIEGKHVFLDLIRPSRSTDFHAGAKDTAHEIVSALGEIAGAYKAEGLREVIAAGQGGALQKKGQILYDFMAQGDDEVTVGIGDEVVILDDTKSEEWWMVRRLKNGREGVVPSSYIEITGIVEPSSTTGINAGRSTVDQNRLEEERLAKEAARKSHSEDSANSRGTEVGPGMRLPERRSSLYAVADSNIPSQRQKRGKRPERGSSSSSKSSEYPYFFCTRKST
jgi:actin cytoskeleton-regulatory complex protein SLA1